LCRIFELTKPPASEEQRQLKYWTKLFIYDWCEGHLQRYVHRLANITHENVIYAFRSLIRLCVVYGGADIGSQLRGDVIYWCMATLGCLVNMEE